MEPVNEIFQYPATLAYLDSVRASHPQLAGHIDEVRQGILVTVEQQTKERSLPPPSVQIRIDENPI